MKIAVLSGKGGTGKTFISVNLTAVSKNYVYADCDVEEPDGHLFFKMQNTCEIPVNTMIPSFNAEKCTGCRECVNFCRYNALVFIKSKPMLFKEMCHSCGGCSIVCSQNAITETVNNVGNVITGSYPTENNQTIKIVSGMMNTSEVSAVPVIKSTLKTAFEINEDIIIDCPPGSGCSVMESIKNADICILVTEGTAFGFHNFKMVHELTKKLNKKSAVIINKDVNPYKELENYCAENNLKILQKIPYSAETAHISGNGKIAAFENEKMKEVFTRLLSEIERFACKISVSKVDEEGFR